MRKILLIVATVTLIVALALCVYACGETEKEITGVKLENATVDYDGQEHALTISGTLPTGAKVDYQNNTGVNAGTYAATATVTCEGYKTLVLNATLTINKINYDMHGVTWNYYGPFTYDGTEKTVTLIADDLPIGVTVNAYTNNSKTDTGEYTASVTFNYDTANYNAPHVDDCNWAIVGQDFPEVTFTGATLDYDGTEHEITATFASALPQGASVVYQNNKGTNAGTYNASVTVSCTGYNTVTRYATLTINKINYDMSGAAWNYTTAFTYNGEEKTVTVVGLPTGVTVNNYSNNSKINAGDYTATVTFNYDNVNYNAPQIAACSWTINKATINAEMSNLTVEYDSLPHSIEVVGNIPAEVTVTYFYNNEQATSATEVGTYAVRCELRGANYNDLDLTATLKITATEEQLYSVVTANGSVYFQNNLDGNKLYKVNGANVAKISNDTPNYMIANGNNVYYYSTSLFSKVIKSFDGNNASTLYSTKGEYLATDGTNIYYAINNLVFNTDQNGIYKLSISGSAQEPVRLVADKAEYLTYANGYVYYSNKSDGGKLYRVSVNANNATGEQLRTDKQDEKVAYLITDGENLYFNSTKTVVGVGIAAAVCKYNIASGAEVKLTTDAGKYLTKVGSYIYYVNNDKITSNLFGDGIYKVSALLTSDSNESGTKVLSIENNGYSSLTSDGENLYYYKLNDKHFYKNSAEGDSEIDLMANFQAVEEDTSLSGYSKLATYKGEIYYTNPLDGSSLYKYNPTNGRRYKVLADSVSYVTFHTANDGNHYMYYTTYVLTNYALFRMNLDTGEIVKISSARLENLIFEDDKIYCLKVTAGRNSIIQMDLDGANEETLYVKNNNSPDTKALYKIDDTFYFVLNPTTGYQNVDSFTIGADDKKDLHRASFFVILDEKIYFFAHTSDHLTSDNKEANAFKVCGLDGKNTRTILKNVDITYMYATDGKVYFASKSSQNSGLFVYDVAENTVTKISDDLAYGMTMLNGKLYFLQSQVTYTDDYPAQSQSCDGHLYCYDGATVTKVA